MAQMKCVEEKNMSAQVKEKPSAQGKENPKFNRFKLDKTLRWKSS